MGGVKTDIDGATDDPGPLRRRRGRLRLGPRRQPPRRQLAARHADLRPPLRRARRRARARAWRCRPPATTQQRHDEATDRRRSSPAPKARPPRLRDQGRARRDDERERRRLPRRGRPAAAPTRSSRRLKEEAKTAYIDDQGTVFNQDVLGAIELGYMLDIAEAIVRRRARAQGAPRRAVPHRLPRAQRRGVAQAHRRLAQRRRGPTISYSHVTITQWQPEERTY